MLNVHNSLRARRRAAHYLAGASILAVTLGLQGAAMAQTDSATSVETVVVRGGRTSPAEQPGGGLLSVETAAKPIQTISEDFIAKQVPTANVEQLMAMLPSANVSQVDPYGLQTGQVYVRGLPSAEISFILEGTPLNDIGNAAFYAHEQVEAEDLEQVQLQPGFVNLGTPTINAVAGQVFMKMRDPDHEFGGLIDASRGSDNMDREFFRLNTGDIGDTGIRAMASYSHTYSDNWQGPGGINKHHLDVKVVSDLDDMGSTASIVTSYNWEFATFYRNPTLAQFNALGNKFTYDRTFTPGDTAYYLLNNNPYKNLTVSAPLHWVVNNRLSFDNTPYVWYGEGSGNFGSTMTPSSAYAGPTQVTLDPVPSQYVATTGPTLVEQVGHNYQLRGGNTLAATYILNDNHTLNLGWWIQLADQHQNTRLGEVNQATGVPVDYWGRQGYFTYNGGTPYDAPNYKNKTTVNALWLGDSMKFFDNRLKIDAGAKYAWVLTTIDSRLAGLNPHQRILTQRFLPQLGASWQFDESNQVYATVSTNFRTPASASLLNQYNRNTGLQSNASGPSKPEFSVSEEVGYRYNDDLIVASISGFHYYFTNRQLALSQQFGSQTLSQTINAGSQETWGIDGQIATTPIYNFRPYLTAEFLDARIKSLLPTVSRLAGVAQADFLPTIDKYQIMSPKFQFGFGLDYDNGDFFATGQVKYVDDQYSTFMNDQKIPGYATSNISLGYRLPPMGIAKAPEIQLNLSNIGDTSALTGVSGFTTNATAQTGVRGGTVAASAPTYYLMPHFTAMVTLSTAF